MKPITFSWSEPRISLKKVDKINELLCFHDRFQSDDNIGLIIIDVLHFSSYSIWFHPSNLSISLIISDISGLSVGLSCKHSHTKFLKTWLFTRRTCWWRLCGSGISRMHISQRRTPKLYTSTWNKKLIMTMIKRFIVEDRSDWLYSN